MATTNRTELIEYALRKLGAPVIQINVSTEQLEDRLDEALSYFVEFHDEGTQKTFIPIKVTGSHLQLTTNVASDFKTNETITGSVSGATMKLFDVPEINKLRSKTFTGTFIAGETVTGPSTSGGTASGVIATNGIFIGDIQNKYLTLSDNVISVIRVLPWTGAHRNNTNYMFDIQYQMMANDIFKSGQYLDMNYYFTLQQHLSLIDFTLNPRPKTEFSRILGTVTLSSSFWSAIDPDQFVMVEGHVSVNDEANLKLYDNAWLKRYLTSIIKKQWASNISKYQNIILPGGVQLNGQQLHEEAESEIEKLEEQLKSTYREPLSFYVG